MNDINVSQTIRHRVWLVKAIQSWIQALSCIRSWWRFQHQLQPEPVVLKSFVNRQPPLIIHVNEWSISEYDFYTFPFSTTEHSWQTNSPVSDLRLSTRFSVWENRQRIGVDLGGHSERRSCSKTASVQVVQAFFSGKSLKWQLVGSSILGRCKFNEQVRDSRRSCWTAIRFFYDFRPDSATGTCQCRSLQWLGASKIS